MVRCLCVHCKQATQVPSAVLHQAGLGLKLLPNEHVEVFTPVGCEHCHKGFSGRTGIFQVMPVSPDMQNLVLHDAVGQEVAKLAQKEGVASLRMAGLRKVLQGITSLDEVMAATREEA
jgi:type IV pilus assembly protein PilB